MRYHYQYHIELKKRSTHLLNNLSDCLIFAPEKCQVFSTGCKSMTLCDAGAVLVPTEL